MAGCDDVTMCCEGGGNDDWVRRCVEYGVEGPGPEGDLGGVMEGDCQAQGLSEGMLWIMVYGGS